MDNVNVMNCCERLAVVKIVASVWTGRKKLRPDDLLTCGGEGLKLPPDKLVSLGSKRIIDPERLNVFNRLKKEAERVCLGCGTRFLSGFAIPDSRLPPTLEVLERIKKEFDQRRADFLADYTRSVEDWASRYPDFRDIVRRSMDPVEKVGKCLSFNYVVFRVSLHPDAPQSLGQAVEKIGQTALEEIAQEAERLLEESLIGRRKVSQKVLNPIRRMLNKIDGLAFADASLRPIADAIGQTLSELGNRQIAGKYLDRLLALVQMLANPDRLRRHGEGLRADGFDFVPLLELESEPEPEPEPELEPEPESEPEPEPDLEPDLWF